jgi:HSP20 family protein
MDKLQRRFAQLACAFDCDMRDVCSHLQLLEEVENRHGTAWRPPTDIYETNDNIILKMAVSGLKIPGGAEVIVAENKIVIYGKREDRTHADRTEFHHMEISYGHFRREFTINRAFDPDHIEAKYEDGYIIVSLPKAEVPTIKRIRLAIR